MALDLPLLILIILVTTRQGDKSEETRKFTEQAVPQSAADGCASETSRRERKQRQEWVRCMYFCCQPRRKGDARRESEIREREPWPWGEVALLHNVTPSGTIVNSFRRANAHFAARITMNVTTIGPTVALRAQSAHFPAAPARSRVDVDVVKRPAVLLCGR